MRNRLAACKLAGVEPKFQRVNGEDQTALIISRNMARRNLNKGQLALIAARISPNAEMGQPKKGARAKLVLEIKTNFPMVNPATLSQARVIVRWGANDLGGRLADHFFRARRAP